MGSKNEVAEQVADVRRLAQNKVVSMKPPSGQVPHLHGGHMQTPKLP
jgi:hypothetical protein